MPLVFHYVVLISGEKDDLSFGEFDNSYHRVYIQIPDGLLVLLELHKIDLSLLAVIM